MYITIARNKLFLSLLIFPLISLASFPETIRNETEIKTQYLWLKVNPSQQGVITQLGLITPSDNIAGPLGMFQEGFGVGSFYVPNRKTNEQWNLTSFPDGKKVIDYTYNCEGPNIQGLHVQRTMELLPHEAGLTVKLTVKNEGKESQWIAPWVANSINPGGKWNEKDLLEIPSTDGIISINTSRHYLSARNWSAYTDPELLENVCLIFHADMLHSFLAVWEPNESKQGIQSWFLPTFLKPGDTWSTMYKLSIVRGLSHVNFASEEMSGQIDYYEDGKLILLLSPNREFKNMRIQARVLAPDGKVWKLPTKKFDFKPNILIRCTYEWKAPGPGRYDFLAQLEQEGKQYYLGKETGSPHGGIDTQFVVGNPENPIKNNEYIFQPWTDAPTLLDKGPRNLTRNLLFKNSDTKIWFENSLFKIYPEDNPEPSKENLNDYTVYLARRERESFQIAIRNNGTKSCSVQTILSDFKNTKTSIPIPTDAFSLFEVKFHHVVVPSYYEGPTGFWPDALEPAQQIKIPPQSTGAFWVTIYAPESLPPGDYQGYLELQSNTFDPIEIKLNIHIFEFALPEKPTLKTDFGFSWDCALRNTQILSGKKPDTAQIASMYLQNAIEHHITLRELTQLPMPRTENYEQELNNILPKIQRLQKAGITNFALPVQLANKPENIKILYNFLQRNNLTRFTFVPLWEFPKEEDMEKISNLVMLWKTNAPNIPLMITTRGLNPILPENVDIWCIHSPIMDTPHNKFILEKIQNGKEVWWCINHAPPRPYANFFLDFAGMEHRIFFWQTWMLGIKGVHYWCVNYSKEKNPKNCPLDVIPTNGDGFLVYPGIEEPVNSIRWEIIRDGVEDYDYLNIFNQSLKELKNSNKFSELVQKAEKIYDFKEIVPDLVNFTRNPELLLSKRVEIAECIEQMLKARQQIDRSSTQTQQIKPQSETPNVPKTVENAPLPSPKPAITPTKPEKPSTPTPPLSQPTPKTPIHNPKSVGFKKKQ